jgi:hypothetical protein
MTSVTATNPGSDERPITMQAWLATDLLRVLDDLRFGWHGRLPAAVRDDLDYHAGLLRVRLGRTFRPHTKENHR